MSDSELTEGQIERYSRNILLREVGGEGQKKLLASSVLMVGAGGLGSPALLYLAAAGVGRIVIAEGDAVELSNLQRQVIHRTRDIGKNKAHSAAAAIAEINPDCKVDVFPRRLDASNIGQIVRDCDIVLDGSDNFPTRFLVADCCRFESVPLVSAAVVRLEGQLMTVLPGQGNPCYRCFIPEPPPPGLVPTCQEAGVLGAVAGVMGTLQAVEALKVLLDKGEIMSHRLLVYDALECRFLVARRAVDPDCPLCGRNPKITKLSEYDITCARGAGSGGDEQ